MFSIALGLWVVVMHVAPSMALEKRQVTSTSPPYQTFKTVNFIEVPNLQISKSGAKLAAGYLFFTPGVSSAIMTDTNELVWYAEDYSSNLKVDTLFGKSVLSRWISNATAGSGSGNDYGEVVILDDTYQVLHTICPNFGFVDSGGKNVSCQIGFHESYITDRGSIIIQTENITTADLSGIGGAKNASVWDNLVYEIDILTQKVLFRWSMLEHVPVNATQVLINATGDAGATRLTAFDPFHINSVQPVGCDFLINARHTWSTYLVSPDGTIKWTIQGETGGDFATDFPAAGNFVDTPSCPNR